MDRTSCPRCGADSADDHRFCEGCGLDLLVRHAATSDTRPPDDPCAHCGSPRPGTRPADEADQYCATCGRRLPDGTDRVEIDLGPLAGLSDRGLVHSRNEDAMGLGARADTGVRAAVVCDGVSSSRTPQAASRAAVDAALAVLLGVETDTPVAAAPPGPEVAPQTGRTVRVRAAAGRLARAARGRAGAHPDPDDDATPPDPAPEDADSEDSPAVALVRRAGEAAARVVGALSTSGDRDGPSCTLVAALVEESGAVTVGWVGDSRAYWLADSPAPDADGSALLTRDHSWAAELVAAGVLDEEAAMRHPRAHAITRWLGPDGTRTPQVRTLVPDGPGTLLICSDGLWNDLSGAADLAAVVRAAGGAVAATRELTRLAIEAGGHDNITAVAIPVPGRHRT